MECDRTVCVYCLVLNSPRSTNEDSFNSGKKHILSTILRHHVKKPHQGTTSRNHIKKPRQEPRPPSTMEGGTNEDSKSTNPANNKEVTTKKEASSIDTTKEAITINTTPRPTTPPLFANHRRSSAPSSFHPFSIPFSTPAVRAPTTATTATTPSTPSTNNNTPATTSTTTPSLIADLAARRRNAVGASPVESSWAGRVGEIKSHAGGSAGFIVEAAGVGREKREELEGEGVRVRDFGVE